MHHLHLVFILNSRSLRRRRWAAVV
eukprot:COSAG05_NODE_21362_length_272_cov_0.890173_2_plen_24_part_01